MIQIAPLLAYSLLAIALCLAIASMLIARSARSHAANCVEWLQKAAQSHPDKAEIAKLSAELTELTDAYHALLASHKKLRSRIGMRENRKRKLDDQDDAELGSMTDKDKLRLAAKAQGLLK